VLTEAGTDGSFDHLFVNRQTKERYKRYTRYGPAPPQGWLPHLRIHDCGTSTRSFLVNSGRTLYEVQQILGHSDPSVTQRYATYRAKPSRTQANSASIAILAVALPNN
jgi:integrase